MESVLSFEMPERPARSLLIVDDDKLICENIKSKLMRLGYASTYAILTANNATEAELLYDKYLPEIVITDIHMPSVSGLALIERFSHRKHHAKIFVLSGYDDYDYVRKAFLLGVTDYMLKPVDIEELHGKLRKYDESRPSTVLQPEPPAEFPAPGGMDGIMQQALHYIDENIGRTISMREIAEHVGLSYSYFSKLFGEYTDMHFSEYIHSRRIEIAKRYLDDPTIKIQDIARKLGYENPSEFSRAFKKYAGGYPTEFRDKAEK